MAAAATLLMTAGFGTTASAQAAASHGCRESRLPVSLAEGRAADQSLFVKLCLPTGAATPSLVQLLVHGITTSHRYWDFPDPKSNGSTRYSYVAAASKAGYATLSIDRIGSGRSSRPPSALVDINLNAHVLHQVIQALRAGKISGPGALRPKFDKVVLVGHSYGTALGWLVATRYPQDVDGLVLSAFGHKMNPLTLAALAPSMYPAFLDPKFMFDRLDPGYLTSRPGTRYKLFYAPAPADAKVVALDEALKETLTLAEFASITVALGTPLDIRVPVMLAMGQVDSLFCQPQLAMDCSSAATLVQDEARFLGSRVPSIDGYVLKNAGHSLNLMQNAPDFFAAVQAWVKKRLDH